MEEYKERHASDDEDENVVEYDEEGNVCFFNFLMIFKICF